MNIMDIRCIYPPCVSWIENKADAGKISEDDIITVEELQKLVSTCKNDRDRAFMQVLFETGARITEFLDIKRKDVKFDNFGAVLKIKTEKRRGEAKPFRLIRINSSVPPLERWLKQIPDEPDQFIWPGMSNRKKQMTYDATYYMIKSAMRKMGLNKRLYPHLFRHSSVSYWHGKGLPEGVLKKRLGWKPGSKMLNRYSHIKDQQTDDATLKLLGYERNADDELLLKKACPRCGTDNEFSNYCSRRYFPLSDNASVEMIEKQRKFEKIMVEAEKDPRFGKILEIMEEIMSKPPH
jgi:integrase